MTRRHQPTTRTPQVALSAEMSWLPPSVIRLLRALSALYDYQQPSTSEEVGNTPTRSSKLPPGTQDRSWARKLWDRYTRPGGRIDRLARELERDVLYGRPVGHQSLVRCSDCGASQRTGSRYCHLCGRALVA